MPTVISRLGLRSTQSPGTIKKSHFGCEGLFSLFECQSTTNSVVEFECAKSVDEFLRGVEGVELLGVWRFVEMNINFQNEVTVSK